MKIMFFLFFLQATLQAQNHGIFLPLTFGERSYFSGTVIHDYVPDNSMDITGQARIYGVSEYNQQEIEISCFVREEQCHGLTEYKNLTTRGTYTGYLQNSRTNGYGKLVEPFRGSYDGNWKNGLKNGYGIEVDVLGNQYAGEFLDGMYHGYGKFAEAGGRVYVGEWVQGEMHGYGSLRWPDGRVFQGEFVQGIPQGIGAIFYPKRGDLIVGEIVDSEVTGIAVQSSGREKRILVGEFRRDQVHGLFSQKIMGQRSHIIGNFDSDKDSGVFLHRTSPNEYYLGEMFKGLPDGYGVQIMENKIHKLGTFRQGKFVSESF